MEGGRGGEPLEDVTDGGGVVRCEDGESEGEDNPRGIETLGL